LQTNVFSAVFLFDFFHIVAETKWCQIVD